MASLPPNDLHNYIGLQGFPKEKEYNPLAEKEGRTDSKSSQWSIKARAPITME
jgi:hypothetical protein